MISPCHDRGEITANDVLPPRFTNSSCFPASRNKAEAFRTPGPGEFYDQHVGIPTPLSDFRSPNGRLISRWNRPEAGAGNRR